MTTKHTPGPWKFSGDEVTARVEGHEVTVCVSPFETFHGSEQTGSWVEYSTNKENMRLIAAAPELLAALEAAHYNEGGYHAWKEQARAAIAKATNS